MSPAESALRAAIWVSPHDDTPRLVYADWLDEHGDPARAEFIRVQCDLARLDEWDDRRPALHAREAELWKAHAKAWRKPLPTAVKRADFRRGFAYPVKKRVTQKVFLALTPDDFAAVPTWEFHFSFFGGAVPRILASDGMSRAGVVNLQSCVRYPALVRTLTADGRFENTAELNLSANDLGPAAAQLLAASDRFPVLRSLDLSYNPPFDTAALEAVVGSPLAARLSALNLRNNPIGNPGLAALAVAPLGALERLDVSEFGTDAAQAFGPDGLTALFNSPTLTGLRELRLTARRLDRAAFAAITDSRPAFRLRRLYLCVNGWEQESLIALAGWPGLRELRSLELFGHPIGPGAARALAGSPHLGPHARLRVSDYLMTQEPVARAALIDRFGPRLELH